MWVEGLVPTKTSELPDKPLYLKFYFFVLRSVRGYSLTTFELRVQWQPSLLQGIWSLVWDLYLD